MGVKALRKIQMGVETTAGTDLAATFIWRGTGVLSDDREVMQVQEDTGYLGGTNRTYVPKLEASLVMDDIEATYEQLPYILEAGIEAETPTQDGSGSDYIYTYNFPTTAQRTINTYTIEGGDDAQAEEMHYSFVRSFQISGAGGEAVMMGASWVGQMDADPDASFTGALTHDSVEEILFGNAVLYVDGTGTYPATTQLANVVHSFTLNVSDTGHKPKYVDNGNLKFASNYQDKPDVTLELQLNHVAGVVTEIGNWRTQTARAIRLQVDGSAVTTAGTTYSNKTLIIDLAGHWEDVGELEDVDGNDTRTLTFRAAYDDTAAAMGRVIVVNELSALP